VRLGWLPEQAKALTRWSQDQTDLSRFSAADLQSGAAVEHDAPLMVSQLLQNGATIIDPNRFQEVLRGSGRVRQMRRINTDYHRLASDNFDLVAQIDELESALKLPNITADQKLRWSEELNTLNKEQRALNRKIEDLKEFGDPTTKDIISGVVLAGDYFMSQWWKPITLVRAAYILRIVPEEIARVTIGGVFGIGRGAFMDYALASMGDIERFGGRGRYTVDGLGRKFTRKGSEYDELLWREQDLIDEIATAKLVDDVTTVGRLETELSDVRNSIFRVSEEAQDIFEQSQISRRRGEALQTITRERPNVSVERKLSANASGGKNLANRTIPAQKQYWVEGVSDYLYQASKDVHLSAVAKVAAGRGLPKGDKFFLKGVRASWDDHVQSGRMLDQREGLVAWMQTGRGRDALDDLVNSYRAQGRVIDPDNFDDVAFVLDRQVEHLGTLVGGSPSKTVFSPSALARQTGDEAAAVRPTDWRLITDPEMEILDAVASGQFKGRALRGMNHKTRNVELNSEFAERLRQYADSDNAPNQILYRTDTIHGEDRSEFLLKRFASWFFTKAYGIPSDKLARSPSFRRFYWLQMQQLIRSADDAAAATLIANAERAGLPNNLLDTLKSNAQGRVITKGGGATLKDLDEVAKGAALVRVRDLLYDASRRGAAMDQLRLITPFGDAWKEVWSTWGKEVVRQRGMPIKRLAKGVQGLAESELMYEDPISGDQVLRVPFSDKLARLPLPMMGSVAPEFTAGEFVMPAQSLNVLGTFSPGLGPVVSTVANTLIPDDPKWDQVRDWFFPVAEPQLPGTEASTDNLYQQLLFPAAWMRRAAALLPDEGPLRYLRDFVNDIEADPAYQATRNHVVQSLASSRPPAETQGAANMKKLFDDADEIARRMYFMRGVIAFIGPGAPLPTYIAETGQGNMSASLLTDEWRRLEQELLEAGQNPGMAAQMMLDTYGPEIWLYTASNSESKIKGAQASQEWWDWYRTGGSEAIDAFPLVGAYFGEIGEFSIDAYGSLFARGIYSRKKGDALYEEAATDLGFLAYNRLRDQFPPEGQRSPEQRMVLAAAREGIQQYWGVSLSGSARIEERDRQIRQFERMISEAENGDPLSRRLLTGQAGEVLREYMAYRAMVSELAIEQFGATSPTSFRQMRAAASLRDGLRELGERLSAQNSTFARMYQYVLEGELFDDEDLDGLAMPRVSQRTPRPGESIPRSMIASASLSQGL